jgi:hypothetical protein
MAEFEDKELDLGEIGKFKQSILEEFLKLYPSPVETAYVERLENYDRRIKKDSEYKIGLFIRLGSLRDRIENLNDLILRRGKLISDFRKYFEAFPNRQGKVHYRG